MTTEARHYQQMTIGIMLGVIQVVLRAACVFGLGFLVGSLIAAVLLVYSKINYPVGDVIYTYGTIGGVLGLGHEFLEKPKEKK